MAIYKEDIVDIELESGTIHRSFLCHAIGLGDNQGNRFGVRLFRHGAAENVGSASVTGLFMAPNGTNYIINGSGNVWKSDNVAGVILPSGCYAVEGQFTLAIKLSLSGVVTTMRIIDGVVSNTGTTGAVVPSSNVPTSDQIIAAYQQAVAVIDSSVRYDVDQSLTAAQKTKARTNIEAAGLAQVVRVDADQSLTSTQKGKARTNIEAAGLAQVVRVDADQSLTSTQKGKARTNIEAAGLAQVVRVDADQELTNTQKGKARTNIAAASQADLEAEATAREEADTDLKSALDTDMTNFGLYLPYHVYIEIGGWTTSGGTPTKTVSTSLVRGYLYTLVDAQLSVPGYDIFAYYGQYGSGSFSGSGWVGESYTLKQGYEYYFSIRKTDIDDISPYVNDIYNKLFVTPTNNMVSHFSTIDSASGIYNVVSYARDVSYTCPNNGTNYAVIDTAVLKEGKYLIRITGNYDYNGSSQCTLSLMRKGHPQGTNYYVNIKDLIWTKPISGAFECNVEFEVVSMAEFDFSIAFVNAINNQNKAGVSNVAITIVDITGIDYPKTDGFYRAIDESNGSFSYNESITINNNIIDCFGDSLTAGTGGTPYPTALSTLLGSDYEVNNYGSGGEVTLAILARLGAIPVFVSPFTADETADIEIDPVTMYGYNWDINIRNGKGMNPATIDGVMGNVYADAGLTHLYFRKLRYEDTKQITRPSMILPRAAKYTPYHTLILFMGQNGGWTGADAEGMLIQQYKHAETFMKSNNYIFVGLTSGTTSSRSSLELLMSKNFGGHYFNARDYLVNYGLADNGLTPTAADEAAIAEGSVPPQLMSDSVHLNTYGYSSLAKGIYNHGKGLGMWD